MEEQDTIDEVFLKRLERRLNARVRNSGAAAFIINKLQSSAISIDDIKDDIQAFLEISIIPALENEKRAAELEEELSRSKRIMSLEVTIGEITKNGKELVETIWDLFKVRAELEKLRAKIVAEDTSEDCDHWQMLLKTHTRYVRELEMDKDAMKLDFPFHKRASLEERTKRVAELRQRIATNCK